MISWPRRRAGCAPAMSRARTSADPAPVKQRRKRRLISRAAISRTWRASSAPECDGTARRLADHPRPDHIRSSDCSLPRESMANPVARFATRFTYGARQLSRVAWYVGHDMVMRRLSDEARRRAGARARPRARTDRPVPERRRLYADMAVLF